MSNYLKMDKKQTILGLLQLGFSYRAIERQTGVRRETVSIYDRKEGPRHQKGEPESEPATVILGFPEGVTSKPATPAEVTAGPPESFDSKPAKVTVGSFDSTPNKSSRSVCEPHREKIEQCLSLGLSAQRIWQDLVSEDGFCHSYESVKRFVRKWKKRAPEVFMRVETPPGQEAQVDFGQGAPTLDPGSGKYRRPHLFQMKLSYSRKSYEEVMWKQDLLSFLRAHENAFRFFGGVPKSLVIDNLKAGVLKACFYEPELNSVYASFAKRCGFVILPCRVRKPEHKGKVEAGVKYTQNNALKGRAFETLQAQNDFLLDWNQTIASTRIHGTTKRQVEVLFQEERAHLQALPENPFAFFKTGTRRVHPDGHIEVEKAYYSVPHTLVGQTVWVKWDAAFVKVQDEKGNILATHLRSQPGRFATQRNHLPPWKMPLEEKYDYVLNKAKGLGWHIGMWASGMLRQKSVTALRSIQGVLSLAKTVSTDQLDLACRLALRHHVLTYRGVKALLDHAILGKPATPLEALLQEHALSRSLSDYQSLIETTKGEYS